MYWLAWLLLNFRGRIPRKLWWLAQAILLVLAVAGYSVVHGFTLPQQQSQSAFEIVWRFVLFLSAYAVTVKRLNDRGHASWVGTIWLGMALVGVIADMRGLFADPMSWGRPGWALFAASFTVSLWFFIDLGMLRGERGPNRHGPDPLGASAGAGTTSAPPSRRTLGASLRDSVVALVALGSALALSGVNLGVADLGHQTFRRLFMPRVLEIERERAANLPAVRAQRDGDAALRAGDYDGAVRNFTRAIELYGPANVVAASSYRTRAIAFHRAGRLQEALADHDKAIALEPNFYLHRRDRGTVLSELGRHDDALKEFAAALRRSPKSADTRFARGRVLEKIGRHEDALADYADAIAVTREAHERHVADVDSADLRERMTRSRDATIAIAHVRRGNIFRTMNRSDEALGEYAQALAVKGDDAFAYVSRGWLHEQQGQRDLARVDYEKAASLAMPDEWLKGALERTR